MSGKALTKILLLAFAGLIIMLAGCDDRKEIDDPMEAAPNAAEPTISYGAGFSAQEVDGPRSWRWMSNEGIVKLKNSNQEMVLSFATDVPMNAFSQPPTIRVIFNGNQLDQFPATQKIMKDYVILADQQNGKTYSELRIVTDKTFIPKDLDKNSSDDRKLGLSLTKLSWIAR